VARVRSSVERAAALHRQAVATADAAAVALEQTTPDEPPAALDARQHSLAATLAELAADIAPGWLSVPWDTTAALPAVGTEAGAELAVRVGVASPVPDGKFPVLVPLLGVGHLAIDAAPHDPIAVGLLRGVVLRLLAAATPGTLRVRGIDPVGVAFAPFQALFDGRLMPPPAAELSGMRTLLAEAEQWVRTPAPPGRHLLFVVAALPTGAEPSDMARVHALASAAASARLTLLVTGLPPARDNAGRPGDDAGMAPVANATTIVVRGRDVTVIGAYGSGTALNSPVELDGDPPPRLLDAVCETVAEQARIVATLRMTDLLPSETWQASSAEGLATTVGLTGHAPLSLRLADLTPHWLIGGRSGAGKTALLINILYGLCSRYSPAELTLYLLDFKEGVSFREFTPTDRDPSWIPHARAVGVESDRAYGLAVLRELDGEMTRRSVLYKDTGVTRFADLRETDTLPRILCVIDEFQVLLAGDDRIARQAVALLESVARKGRSYGIHLILASQTMRGVESLYSKRDSIFGQFPVRIALPGGGDVLDVRNASAAALRLGTAVVNTAGGLGGPSGAARAHERLIDFPDPHAEPRTLATLRRRLWLARSAGAQPPYVFEGYAPQYLPTTLPTSRRRVAYLGRVIDVPLSLAAFTLDGTPGRHLAVIGPSEMGAGLLDAAVRSLAAQVEPGSVRFVLAPLVAASDAVGADLAAALADAGHSCDVVDAKALRGIVADPATEDTYVFGFGLDGAADLRSLLRDGPARNVHVFGWWRGLRRFGEDTGGSAGREDVAGVVLLNVPATDAAIFLGELDLDWQPRANRALFHDRHAARTEVIVPFARAAAGRVDVTGPGAGAHRMATDDVVDEHAPAAIPDPDGAGVGR
jgi:DNA segregation ATPase FtsK/SpoIIIE, S-DNA-T family